ncbi:hypothetical protein UA08_05425 [Talaromyces atroroseus]|uniref:Restriction of telomere capping protein 4 n=1 Tax=Talaromyces atroroseus TaxID=1441469 RepID=A0A225AE69_TALAT|nr:hypothetical protein UA08_05425 [Talaromyces atroroseus]OKL59531.1 hypothetical protein UA08_05425 [Talaromyces atroroseus]
MYRRTRLARDASIALTRENNLRGVPLSQVGGIKIKQRDHNKGVENSPHVKQEPGTDDEPLSSSEEEETKEEGEEEEKTIKEEEERKVAAKKAGATKRKRNGRDDPETKSKSQKSNPPSSAPSDEIFHSSLNTNKPRKRTMYGKSSQHLASSQDSFKQPPPEYKDSRLQSTPAFQVPPTVEVDGLPSLQKEPAFRMPAAIQDSHELHDVQFIQPAACASSSALTAGDLDFILDDDDDLSPLSSPPSDVSLAMAAFADKGAATLPVDPTVTGTTEQSRCPNCNAPVDADLLDEFLAQRGRRLRDERLFCERHKAHKAEKEWSAKGYPTIDWHTFDERIQRHFSALERLLVPSPSSFYRGLLESSMKAGQARVFKMSLEEDNLESLSCGYYGPKGASRMLNSVTSKYSRKLRQLAAMDKILKTAGPTTYAQAVLVPELAVLLIKEDMKVDSQDAREILRDSTDIGNRLNAAEDDQIPVAEDDDDGGNYI